MGDIFESDIEDENIDLSELEDKDNTGTEASYVNYSSPLFRLRLDYCHEGLYATVPQNMELQKNDFVIIPTRYGKDMARVMGLSLHPSYIKRADLVEVERKATQDELDNVVKLRQREIEAGEVFREKVKIHRLDMKLIATHFLLDEQRLLFFFASENRVDFRELVKDMSAVLRTRLELRQVNPREEARMAGGIGVCGRPFCCHDVCDKLHNVSIKMAKEQNFSLNSMKISGQCGRLLCCLAFEYDWYVQARKALPQVGLHFNIEDIDYRIIEANPLTAKIKLLGNDGSLKELSSDAFVKTNGKWELNSIVQENEEIEDYNDSYNL